MWSEIKEFVINYVDENKDEFWEVSKKIWEKPELGMEEHFASGQLVELLRKHGFEVEVGVAGMPTAFVATYGEGSPVIGFSSEFDALPGLSQELVVEKSPMYFGYPGHGCGHNLIAIGGIMTAVALKEAMKKFDFKATLKVFGTPAEELCIGKPIMAAAGCFEGVDIILDWHPLQYTSSNATRCSAYFNMKFHYKGKTAHGNAPWHGKSALDAAVLQAHAIEMIREHIKPGDGELAANTINYTFSDTGPEFASVVPDRATLWCIGRMINAEQLKDAMDRVVNAANGAALALGVEVETEYITATHELIPNIAASKVVYNNLKALGNVEFDDNEVAFVKGLQENEGQDYFDFPEIKDFCEDSVGVTDSSEYSWFAPYVFLAMRLGPGPGWHNWMVTACSGNTHGLKAVTKAAQALSTSAIDFISDENLILEAKKELQEKLDGRVYKSLLPDGTPIPLDISKESMSKYKY